MMKLVKINGEYDIWLPEHRANRPEWFAETGWEKIRLDSITHIVDPEDIFYYIGNEEGDCAAIVAMCGCKMILAEPNLKVWPNTKAIWEANTLDSPLVCFVGFISETSSEIINLVYNGFPECADGEIISDHGFLEVETSPDIQRITIDDLVHTTKLIPKHISIDIEGHEAMALEGAKETLKKYRPNIWLSAHPEMMMEKYGQHLADLRRWIMDIGYTEHLLEYPLHEIHFLYQSNKNE